MIHYIKVRNFMSFKDEVCLDFEATDDKRFEDYHVVKMADGTRLLRFAVLYGANASGKSNLVKAIQFLSYYWRNVNGENINTIPFLFNEQTSQELSEFELAFYVGDNRYEYHLKILGNKTHLEELLLDNTEQPISIIRRERIDNHTKLFFNTDIIQLSDAANQIFSANCLDQMSFLAARNKVNLPNIPYLDEVLEWTSKNIMMPITPKTNLNKYWEERLAEDDELHKYLIDFIHKADYNIENIEINIDRHFVGQNIVRTIFTHSVTDSKDEYRKLPSHLQSDGTLRTIAIGILLHDMLKTNAFVAIDEIETSLHPELIEFIINQFIDTAESRSQMLITTHYAKLLDTVDDILRRDSIWFVEKHKNGSSELYSLIEFKGVDDMDHLHGAYMNGCFGALPHIKF